MHSISNVLIKIDTYLDYVPIVSTATNLVVLFEKCVLSCISTTLPATHYFKYISDKSILRCFTLLVPVLGNIAIAFYDMSQSMTRVIITEEIPVIPESEPEVENDKTEDEVSVNQDAEVLPDTESKLEQEIENDYSEARKFFSSEETDIDAEKAYQYLERAAKHNSTKALNLLGDLYAFGLYVQKDDERAVEFYHRAYKIGDESIESNLKKLCTSLGTKFFELQDIAKALYYYEIASSLQCPFAKVYIGITHFFGIETNEDPDKALEFFCSAIDIVLKSDETPETAVEIEKLRNALSSYLQTDKSSIYRLFPLIEEELKNELLLKKSADFFTFLNHLLSVQ